MKLKKVVKVFFINTIIFFTFLYGSLFLLNPVHKIFISGKETPHSADQQLEFRTSPIPKELFKEVNPALKNFSILNQDQQNKYPPNYNGSDIIAGQKYNSVARIKNTDLIAYNVDYVFDQKYIRHVENQGHKNNTKHFILNAGCSNTFGEGLNQGEDYPSLLSKKMDSTWKVYNWGYHGNGPNSFIDRIQNNKLRLSSINELDGIYTWLFISDHLSRYFCQLSCYNIDRAWALNLPQVEFKKNTFTSRGSFYNSTDPWRIILVTLQKLHFFDFLILPELQNSKNQFIEFAHAIDFIPSMMNSKIKKKYFLFLGTSIHPSLRQELTKLKYKIITLNPYLKTIPDHQRKIPGDGHPTAAANWIISDVIQEAILKDFAK